MRSRLRFDSEVGAYSQGKSLAAAGVGEPPQLDDSTGSSVAGCVEVRQAQVVGAPVHAVDDGVSRPLQLVIEAAGDELAEDWSVVQPLRRRPTRTGCARPSSYAIA